MAVVAVHGVAARHRYLLPLHLVVHVVRMALAGVVLPVGGTSCRTRHAVVDAVLAVHRTHANKTVVRNHVVAEHVEILLNHRAQILAELLGVLHKLRVDVGLESADAVVVLDESSAGCLLHHVEHVLAVAHAVEEGGQGAEVLCRTAEVEQVRVDTLELVHDGAYVVYAVCELNAHALLYHAHESVAVHHGREVVQTVGQGESLRIGHALPHLLDAAVDIAEVRIHALHLLAVENGLQAEHTVG